MTHPEHRSDRPGELETREQQQPKGMESLPSERGSSGRKARGCVHTSDGDAELSTPASDTHRQSSSAGVRAGSGSEGHSLCFTDENTKI